MAKTEAKPPLRIVSLTAENFKRLKAVEIRPGTLNVVEVTGANGAGKTSVLDALWAVLAGAGVLQAEPIRKGEERAVIKLDLGELIVIRTITRKAAKDGQPEGLTHTLKVQTADGARFDSPQAVLDAIVGELALDPLTFARMKPKEQFDALKAFVPDVDFAKLEGLNRRDYDARTDANKDAKAARARAEGIQAPEEAPARVDVSATLAAIEEAETKNRERERRADQRSMAQQRLAGVEEQIAELTRERDELKAKLDGAEPLPDVVDVAPLRAKLAGAEEVNRAADRFAQKKTLIEEAEAAEAKAAELTSAIEARVAEVARAVAAAKMPVQGLSFGEDHVRLNDAPFEQASDAEQLRASMAIAAAMNPRLAVIRVRDGSLLDDNAMRAVEAFAAERGLQVWIERVDTSGTVGFVIEDGMVAHVPTESGEAPPAPEQTEEEPCG